MLRLILMVVVFVHFHFIIEKELEKNIEFYNKHIIIKGVPISAYLNS